LLAVVERRPGVPLRSAAHICQPWDAFVLTVPLIALDSVGFAEVKAPSDAAFEESEKLNVGLTLADTAIWSALLPIILIAVVIVLVSPVLSVTVGWNVPVEVGFVTASEFVKSIQYVVLAVKAVILVIAIVWLLLPDTAKDPPGKPVTESSVAQVLTSFVIAPEWTKPPWPLHVVESAPFISIVSAVAPASPDGVLKTKRMCPAWAVASLSVLR
jgi:hypothetical protein